MYVANTNQTTHTPANIGVTRKADAGTALFWEGDEACTLYRVKSGVARAVRYDQAGDRHVVAFFKPGDVLGVPIDPTYTYTAEAITDLQYVAFGACSWDTAEKSRDALMALKDAIRSELKSAQVRLDLVAQTGSISRIAGFLILFSEGQNGETLPVTIPQLDIASYLALTPETVCRTVKKLKTLGAISMPKRDTFVVEDLFGLERIMSRH